ncbi:MAG: aspartate aminotransferase [Saprospiraceae bacterium]|jgi:aspartate aminotransferase
MQNINLAVGYHNIPNFHHLNLSLTDQLTDAEYHVPSPFQGLEGFREAISAKLQIANGVQALSEESILVTQGASQGIYLSINTLVKEDDEILLPLPAWGYFQDVLKNRKVNIKTVQTQVENQYKITALELEDNLTQDTKMLIFTHPGNPNGGVYTHKELEEIVKVIEKFPNLIILSDEVYELLIFNKKKPFFPLSTFPSITKQIITINGFSKSFGLTSWRIAYTYSHNQDWINQLTDLQKLMTYGLPVATQRIAWTALQKERLYALIWQQMGMPRRQQLFDFFEQNIHADVFLPDGAYFLFPNLKKLCDVAGFTHSADLPLFLAENYNLNIADGAVFGMPFHYRINFMQTEGIIQESINRFKEAFSELSA